MRKQKYGHKIWILCMTLATLVMITPIIMMVMLSICKTNYIPAAVIYSGIQIFLA